MTPVSGIFEKFKKKEKKNRRGGSTLGTAYRVSSNIWDCVSSAGLTPKVLWEQDELKVLFLYSHLSLNVVCYWRK